MASPRRIPQAPTRWTIFQTEGSKGAFCQLSIAPIQCSIALTDVTTCFPTTPQPLPNQDSKAVFHVSMRQHFELAAIPVEG